jgi:phage protein D/phage baseplate assembly protein gpV
MAEQQQPHTATFQIEVDGTPLPVAASQQLISAYVDDSRHLPDMFSLTFRDPHREILGAAHLTIGSRIRIAVVTEAVPSGEPLVAGEVTAVEAEYDAAGAFTVLRGMDESHRLFRGRRTETYLNVTYADIAKQVAARAGLTTGTIDSTPAVHPHVAQANVSDWQFLQELATEVGYEVDVRDGALGFHRPQTSATAPGAGGLRSADPLQLVHGSNLLRYRAIVTAASQVEDVQVRGWDPSNKRAVVATAPAQTTSAALSVTPAGLAKKFGGGRHVGVDVPYATQQDVDRAALALADRIASSFAELEGLARGNPKLKAGSAVSLSLVGDPFDGKYTVTSSRHTYDPDNGYRTAFTVSGRHERSMLGLAGGLNGASASRSVPGVVVGQVSDVNDPDSLGRVKLTFPWLSDTYVSDWTRTCQDGAGSARGAVVLPEVNDEVLVAFDQGDVRRPYVVGGLHNGVDKAPTGASLVDASTGAVRRRGFVSKKGHSVVFFDDDSKQGVALMTGDQGLRLSLNQSTTTVRVTSSGSVEISGSTDVKISAGTDLTLEAKSSLTLSGAKVSVKAQGPVEVTGTPIKLN